MNILYIWDADYPWDVRVEKICRALNNNGHTVHIASRNLQRNPVYEAHGDLHIHRLKTWKNDRLNYFLSFPLFFSPIWKRFLDNIIQNNDIDLVIVRDLPMAIAGIWAGKRFKIPVIFDMAEDYVAMIESNWTANKYKGINVLVRNPYLAKYVEYYALKNTDYVLVVVEEAIKVVLNGGGDLNRTAIVSNTPQLDKFKSDVIIKNSHIDTMMSRYSVIYTGGVQIGRGIQTVLDAIPEIIQYIPDFLFVVVGSGYASSILKQKIKDKGIGKYVLWVGWVNHYELFDYIKSCKVGIIPHFATDHVNTTIPNKIFDYMGCGLPIITSDAIPLKRVLDEEQCGITFRSGDTMDLVKAVIEIYKSKETLEYGKNGLEAVKNKYNWNVDSAKLIEVVNKLGV